MQVPFWEDSDAYFRNSPVLSIPRMKTPLLVAFGDKDGAVDWASRNRDVQPAARRAGKQFVLLVYPGENHGLAKKPNQIDYLPPGSRMVRPLPRWRDRPRLDHARRPAPRSRKKQRSRRSERRAGGQFPFRSYACVDQGRNAV